MNRICGGQRSSGKIKVGGAKMTALPLLTAELLTDEFLVLSTGTVPGGQPGRGLLLERQGIAVQSVTNDGCKLSFAGSISNTEAPYDLLRKTCATFLVLRYLLAWMSEALLSLPGGYIDARVKGRLRCATIVFPFFAVGSTENLLMVASPAEGRLS
jgi:UDP-N-acetylglucosamine 1-carboxyvinyltransferase